MPAAPRGAVVPGTAAPTAPLPAFQPAAAGPARTGGAPATPGQAAQPIAPGQAAPPTAPGTDQAPQQPPQPAQAFTDVNERNEFQDFVAQSTGRVLPLFGYTLFRGVPSTFAPVDRIPVTPDYVIGPGDQIMIRAWGQIDVDYAASVDRNGQISIPKVGVLNVAGLRFQDLHGFLKTAIGRIFRNFEINVTMGALRSIQIFVVGQAMRPGTYTVSSLSTLVNAIFASGGPSEKGSMRRIQLKRGNQTVTEFDMYDLLVHGDKSKDVPLLPGDVIYIPPVGQLAAIAGSVNVSAIFELKDKTILDELIKLAGGFTTTAQGQKALVDRIFERKVRRVEEFPLDAAGLSRPLKDGDIISIASIAPRFDNAVRLQGNVAAPARYPWKQGMRVTDLLVDENALITTDYWNRQNQGALYRSHSRREVNFDYAAVQRLDRDGLVTRLFAFSLGKAIRGDQRENVVLQPGDVVAIYGFDDALPKAENDVVLQGSVLGLPARRFPWREGMRLLDLIPSAQWLIEYYDYWLRLGAPSSRAEIPSSRAEIYWDYANISRLQPSDLTKSLIPLNLGKAVLEGDPTQNVPLRAGDEITLFAKSEIVSRQSRNTILVRLEGEFAQAGVYQAMPGETVRELVVRVGGVTSQAYLFGAEFTRESAREQQERNYQEVLNRLARELEEQAVGRTQSVLSPEEAQSLTAQAASQRELIARMRTLKPTGRIALDLPPNARLAHLPDLALESGDRLYVPPRPSMVSVYGAVFTEASFLYRPERRVSDYLALAGGPTRRADTSQVFMLRVDGSAVGPRGGIWFGSKVGGESVLPGDTIVVPQDLDRTTLARSLKDWTQILYQFGLGAAAIKVLKN